MGMMIDGVHGSGAEEERVRDYRELLLVSLSHRLTIQASPSFIHGVSSVTVLSKPCSPSSRVRRMSA